MNARTFLFAFLLFLLPLTGTARDENSAVIGAEEHPVILAQFGGEIANEALKDYVQSLGLSLVALTDEAQEKWTFTILDSPVVNAFALPGGYVYVTRGLLALANSEAELASVLGHEIGHILSEHGEARIRRNNRAGLGVLIGTVLGGIFGGGEGAADAIELGATIAGGILASHSKAEELEADAIGVRLLGEAGYDPFAAADFLDQLAAKERLERQIAGQQYNPNVVDFFASHPATGARKRMAAEVAEKAGSGANPRQGVTDYLTRIDGMIYGDSAAQGFIRGQTFSHPEMRFTFTLPDGFLLQNSPSHVSAQSARGARFVLSGDLKWSGPMTGYITKRWRGILSQEGQLNALWDVRPFNLNGLDAATAMADLTTQDGQKRLHMIAVRFDNTTLRLVSVTDRADGKSRNALNSAMQSFRRLSRAEARSLRPYRIRIRRIGNQSIARLIATMPLTGFQEEQFRVMNGYKKGQQPKPGDLVKVVD